MKNKPTQKQELDALQRQLKSELANNERIDLIKTSIESIDSHSERLRKELKDFTDNANNEIKTLSYAKELLLKDLEKLPERKNAELTAAKIEELRKKDI